MSVCRGTLQCLYTMCHGDNAIYHLGCFDYAGMDVKTVNKISLSGMCVWAQSEGRVHSISEIFMSNKFLKLEISIIV